MELLTFAELFHFLVVGEASTRPEINIDVEIIALFLRSVCNKPKNYPVEKSLSFYGTFLNNIPIVCSTLVNKSLCYGYNIQREFWNIQSYSPIEERIQAASCNVHNGSWIITGGQKYIEGTPILLNTSEILNTDGIFYMGPTLPLFLSGHCSLLFNNSNMFISGGFRQPDHLRSSYFFNFQKNIWSSLHLMKHERYGHACGRILSKSNELNVIVIGGLHQNSMEIYLPHYAIWIDGPNIEERPVFKAATVQGLTTFVLNGGIELEPNCMSDKCRLNEIYIFDVANNRWTKSDKKMKSARGNHASIFIKNDVDCSSKLRDKSKFLYAC